MGYANGMTAAAAKANCQLKNESETKATMGIAKELTDKVSSEHLHVVIVADNVCPDVAGITTIEETHRQLAQVIDHFQTTIATNVVAVFIGYKVCLFANEPKANERN